MNKEVVFQVGQVYDYVDKDADDRHNHRHSAPNHSHTIPNPHPLGNITAQGLHGSGTLSGVHINGSNVNIGSLNAYPIFTDSTGHIVTSLEEDLTIVHIENLATDQKLVVRNGADGIYLINASEFKSKLIDRNRLKLNLAKTLEQMQSNVE